MDSIIQLLQGAAGAAGMSLAGVIAAVISYLKGKAKGRLDGYVERKAEESDNALWDIADKVTDKVLEKKGQ